MLFGMVEVLAFAQSAQGKAGEVLDGGKDELVHDQLIGVDKYNMKGALL
jgi:hypothetical protein